MSDASSDTVTDPARDALELQADACRALGSDLYADLLRQLLADFDAGGLTRLLLHGASEKPVHDAVVLRLLGAVHRIALRGDAPGLAAHYPSCGGDGSPVPVSMFLQVVEANLDEVRRGLAQQVQTNEVGRAVVLVALSHWLAGVGVDSFDLIEIGTSAGLNQNFDRLGVEAPTAWFERPGLSREPARCVARSGCDVSPLDVDRPEDVLRLQSFVWPDQLERMARLRRAIEVAQVEPPRVERASADEFVGRMLQRHTGRTQVVFHSIVWPYLGEQVQRAVSSAIAESGRRRENAVVWARMEPAGAVADFQVDVHHPGGVQHHRLAEVGYHGQDFVWLG